MGEARVWWEVHVRLAEGSELCRRAVICQETVASRGFMDRIDVVVFPPTADGHSFGQKWWFLCFLSLEGCRPVVVTDCPAHQLGNDVVAPRAVESSQFGDWKGCGQLVGRKSRVVMGMCRWAGQDVERQRRARHLQNGSGP